MTVTVILRNHIQSLYLSPAASTQITTSQSWRHPLALPTAALSGVYGTHQQTANTVTPPRAQWSAAHMDLAGNHLPFLRGTSPTTKQGLPDQRAETSTPSEVTGRVFWGKRTRERRGMRRLLFLEELPHLHAVSRCGNNHSIWGMRNEDAVRSSKGVTRLRLWDPLVTHLSQSARDFASFSTEKSHCARKTWTLDPPTGF